MMVSAKRILEGEEFPKGYGFAYMESTNVVCYPLGLNWIMWAWHRFINWLRNPPPHKLDVILRREYKRGYKDGFSRAARWLTRERDDNEQNSL